MHTLPGPSPFEWARSIVATANSVPIPNDAPAIPPYTLPIPDALLGYLFVDLTPGSLSAKARALRNEANNPNATNHANILELHPFLLRRLMNPSLTSQLLTLDDLHRPSTSRADILNNIRLNNLGPTLPPRYNKFTKSALIKAYATLHA
jgi:hypothetical protein